MRTYLRFVPTRIPPIGTAAFAATFAAATCAAIAANSSVGRAEQEFTNQDYESVREIHRKGYYGFKKPPYSNISLITMAIQKSKKKMLNLYGIGQWIKYLFPYFRDTPAGWEYSIFYTLCFNDCFVKVPSTSNKPEREEFWTLRTLCGNISASSQVIPRHTGGKRRARASHRRQTARVGATPAEIQDVNSLLPRFHEFEAQMRYRLLSLSYRQQLSLKRKLVRIIRHFQMLMNTSGVEEYEQIPRLPEVRVRSLFINFIHRLQNQITFVVCYCQNRAFTTRNIWNMVWGISEGLDELMRLVT